MPRLPTRHFCRVSLVARSRSAGSDGQAERVATMSAKSSSASRTGPSGSTVSSALASCGPGDDVGAGLVHRRVRAQQGERLGVQAVVGEVGVEQLEQPGVLRAGRRAGPSAPAASARPRAGRCRASCRTPPDSEAMSRMSSESWKAEPTMSPYAVSASSTSGGGAAEAGAVAGRGGDQRAGLAGHDVEVVLERVVAGAGLHGLQDLALDEPGERLGLDPYGVGAELGGQLRGLREQEVAGEDRDVVVPARVGRLGAAAQRRPRPSRRRGRARRGGSARPRRPR